MLGGVNPCSLVLNKGIGIRVTGQVPAYVELRREIIDS